MQQVFRNIPGDTDHQAGVQNIFLSILITFLLFVDLLNLQPWLDFRITCGTLNRMLWGTD